MSSRSLNPAPSWRTIALAQLRLVALLQRRDFYVLGAIAAGLVALAVFGYTRGNMEAGTRSTTLRVFPALAYPLAIIGAFWPLGVWPLGSGYRARRLRTGRPHRVCLRAHRVSSTIEPEPDDHCGTMGL